MMKPILRISESLSIAFHAGALLAAAEGETLSAARMAGQLGVSVHHLSKVMKLLAAREIVRSWPGPGGGYILTRNPSEITLLNVHEAVEGPLKAGGCLLADCPNDPADCPLGSFITRVGREYREKLATIKLSDFAHLRGLFSTRKQESETDIRRAYMAGKAGGEPSA